jgi:hypothetical protein
MLWQKENSMVFYLYSSLDRLVKLGSLASVATTKNLSVAKSSSSSYWDGLLQDWELIEGDMF